MTTKVFQAERLLKLADFLDALPPQKFNYALIVDEKGKSMLDALKAGDYKCGTVACAIGWMPAAFPDEVKWFRSERDGKILWVEMVESGATDWDAAEEYFGISSNESDWLFQPNGGADEDDEEDTGNGLGSTATPKEVAAHIREFVREKVGAGGTPR